MARKKPKYVICIFQTFGKKPLITCEVTGSKGEKILDLLDSDIVKYKKRLECTSITLERFFVD